MEVNNSDDTNNSTYTANSYCHESFSHDSNITENTYKN